jgi:hypothetical protein
MGERFPSVQADTKIWSLFLSFFLFAFPTQECKKKYIEREPEYEIQEDGQYVK